MAGLCPAWWYQNDHDALGEQREGDGALTRARLRASPAPVMFLASLIATSMAQRQA